MSLRHVAVGLVVAGMMITPGVVVAKAKFKSGVYFNKKLQFQVDLKGKKVSLVNIPCLAPNGTSVSGTAGMGNNKAPKISSSGKFKFSGTVNVGDDNSIQGENLLVVSGTFSKKKVTVKIISFAGQVACAPKTITGKYTKG